MALFEKAMGFSSSLKLRVSHLGLGDVDLSDKWHADSSLLAPQKLFGKDVTGVEKRGVKTTGWLWSLLLRQTASMT